MTLSIQFLGAVGTVTGSKYLITAGKTKVLVDCGLFQGYKQLRLRNWGTLPVDPTTIDAVVLTHAHIDHSGYLPRLVKQGYEGPVYTSPGTHDLCHILLPDSGYLQEEEAHFMNRHGLSKHRPALPLYTLQDAQDALKQLETLEINEPFFFNPEFSMTLLPAGHILGATMVRFTYRGEDLLFSGDLGRPDDVLMKEPVAPQGADWMVLESTYGNRLHKDVDPGDKLAQVIKETFDRGGSVLIPAFAVGRTQSVLLLIHRLMEKKAIPEMPVYLNSPMATKATRLYQKHMSQHRMSEAECHAIWKRVIFTESTADSKALNENRRQKIVISASGMASGGRVLHHLKEMLPDKRHTVLFTGYQAGGTRGASLVGGAQAVKIHGQYVPVKAHIDVLSNMSAHADRQEILSWVKACGDKPKEIFVVHGEPDAADALRLGLKEELGIRACVPEYLEKVKLI